MASSGKRQTTMAKLNRESRLRERRQIKDAKKKWRKENPGSALGDTAGEVEEEAAESVRSGRRGLGCRLASGGARRPIGAVNQRDEQAPHALVIALGDVARGDLAVAQLDLEMGELVSRADLVGARAGLVEAIEPVVVGAAVKRDGDPVGRYGGVVPVEAASDRTHTAAVPDGTGALGSNTMLLQSWTQDRRLVQESARLHRGPLTNGGPSVRTG